MGGATGAVLGAAGSLFGAKQAANAQQRAAQSMQQLSAPYLAEAQLALPRLRALAEAYYAPRVGKDSPWLRAEHEGNLSALQRANTQQLAEVQHTYAGRGNLGRARGERLRLADQLLQTLNREHLRYGEAQESYRDTTAAEYQEIPSALAGLGRTGMATASQGLKLQAQASRDFWETFARIFGAKLK